MNEHQIAFDQRLQAIRITMARPRFETFSIRGSWNCAAGSLQQVRRVWTHSSIEVGNCQEKQMAATPAMIQFLLISKSPTTEHPIGRAPFGPME
jgi:cobalamin biosynthesis Mg chelatase CobN